MKYTNLNFLLLIYLISSSTFSNPTIESVETISNNSNILKMMRVDTDKDNLLLRESPNTKSKIIIKIENYTYVDVLEIHPDTVTINQRKGNWTKILYNDKTGWVFGGYLRDLRKASINTIDDCPEGGISNGIEQSLEKEFGKIGDYLPHKNPMSGKSVKNGEYIEAYNLKFKGNIIYSHFAEYGHGEIVVVFKNRSFKEVFQRFQKCDSRFQTDEILSKTNFLAFDFIDKDEPEVYYWEYFYFYKDGSDTIVTYTWTD
jgi:hypothetical protein